MVSLFTPAPSRLSDLREGESGVLGEFKVAPALAEHLMNLGFVPGVRVTMTGKAPGGCPCIYRVDGTVVALRRKIARGISITPSEIAAD